MDAKGTDFMEKISINGLKVLKVNRLMFFHKKITVFKNLITFKFVNDQNEIIIHASVCTYEKKQI